MNSIQIIASISIVTAGLTIAIGCIGPALGQGRAVSSALTALAQQPDAASTKASCCSRRRLLSSSATAFWRSAAATVSRTRFSR